MESLLQDIRYGTRMLTKNPGFTLITVLTLALGIGANTAIFSMVDSILLRPLPVKDPGRIMTLAYQQKQANPLTIFSVADYRDIRNQTAGVFSEVLSYTLGLDGISVNGKSDRILSAYVTGNYFSMLGIQPVLGRFILPTEGEVMGADPVMVISYSYWKVHFGGDPSIVGRKVTFNGHPVTIIGVAPSEFYGLNSFTNIQAYLPLGMATLEGIPSDFMTNRALRNNFVFARLKNGVSLAQAQAALSVVAQRLSHDYPKEDRDLSLQAFPELRARPNPDPQNTLVVISGLFLGLAGMVLLLACVNVTNILLVRATVREREMAIRAALGAARGRLIRQLLTESILLAVAGGVAGILFGWWASSTLGSVNLQTDLPVRLDFSFDWRIFAYAFAAALLTGLIVGTVPALRASRGSLANILHEGGRGLVGGRNKLRNALVVAQVGGSLMLLIIAGLFTRSLTAAQRSNLGFDPNHVLNLSMDPNEIGYSASQGREFYKNLLDRVRALPGVVSASTANIVPMGYYSNADTLSVEGYQPPPGETAPLSQYNVVSTDYFKTLGIGMAQGRIFTESDNENAPYVAIVNETMAKHYWPSADPIGRSFKIGSDPAHSIQIVGVAKNSRIRGITGPINDFFYVPFAQHYALNSLETLQLRTTAPPETMIPEVERIIESLAPEMPVFDVKTMTQALDTLNGLLIFQVGAGLAASLGLLGLILAIVGVYGVVSYAASQRTHEIGIRMALGAEPTDILKMIFGQGFLIVGIGLVIGLAAAFAAARVVGRFLTVSPIDPVTYLTVSVVLILVALTACYLPARRAMRVQPMVALHYE